jgi:hypothetical protein
VMTHQACLVLTTLTDGGPGARSAVWGQIMTSDRDLQKVFLNPLCLLHQIAELLPTKEVPIAWFHGVRALLYAVRSTRCKCI